MTLTNRFNMEMQKKNNNKKNENKIVIKMYACVAWKSKCYFDVLCVHICVCVYIFQTMLTKLSA